MVSFWLEHEFLSLKKKPAATLNCPSSAIIYLNARKYGILKLVIAYEANSAPKNERNNESKPKNMYIGTKPNCVQSLKGHCKTIYVRHYSQ